MGLELTDLGLKVLLDALENGDKGCVLLRAKQAHTRG